ncbi:MAG: hypothetical protein WCE30_09185 [Mycobacterium sp.]
MAGSDHAYRHSLPERISRGLTMVRTRRVLLAFIAAWLAFAPLASAKPIGECRSICEHHRGDFQFCYDDCLRR